MQYLMKKEATDFIDRSVGDRESGDGKADLQLFAVSAVTRGPGTEDRMAEHFLSVPVCPLAFGSSMYHWACCCITKMCSFCLLVHPCSLNLADPYAPTCLIPLTVLQCGTAHCSLLKEFFLQPQSNFLPLCFGDLVVLPVSELYFLTVPGVRAAF